MIESRELSRPKYPATSTLTQQQEMMHALGRCTNANQYTAAFSWLTAHMCSRIFSRTCDASADRWEGDTHANSQGTESALVVR
jgi:hypothetical protein